MQSDGDWEKGNIRGLTKVPAEVAAEQLSACAIPKDNGMRLFVSFDGNLIERGRVDGLIGWCYGRDDSVDGGEYQA